MRQLYLVFDQMMQHRIDRTPTREDLKDQCDYRLRLFIRILDDLP